MSPATAPTLRKAIETVLNAHSAENGSNTPDYILATYLESCLEAFDHAVASRDRWYGVHLEPGNVNLLMPERRPMSPPMDAAAFAALVAIEGGEWDRYLGRLRGAINERVKTDEYKSTLIAGER